MRRKILGPAVLISTVLLAVVAGFQNCAPTLLEEEDSASTTKKSGVAQVPPMTTLAGVNPLPSVPTYSQPYTQPSTQPSTEPSALPGVGGGSLPISAEVIKRVCRVQYASATEVSFEGQAVPKEYCLQRFQQFIGNTAFDSLQLNCTWGSESCGFRAPVVTEDLRVCRINYGGHVEVSFDGQSVAKSFCEARYNQFVGNAAFNGLHLECSFGSESCGSRGPVANQVLGPCVITFASLVERSFDGQMVTRDLCVARYNQFLSHPAFNPYRLTCTFNNSDHCGSRDPL